MDSQETILRKTFGLLLLKGFDAVSITDIQNVTGLSRGLLYHYFKNKEDLFIQVTEKYFISIFDFDLSKIKGLSVFEFVDFICDRFRTINKTITDIIIDNKMLLSASILNYHFLFYQVIQRDEVFRHNYRITTEKEQIGWECVLKNSVDNNEIRQDIDVFVSAQQLFTLTDGIWFQAIFNTGDDGIYESLKSILSHYITLLR